MGTTRIGEFEYTQFKQDEIQKCQGCGKGLGHNNDLDFYRLKVERFMLNHQVIRKQAGLEMMLGEAAPLARIMGSDPDIANGFGEHTFLICGSCAMPMGDSPPCLAALMERVIERDTPPEEEPPK